ncbi:hypothetical protein KIH45_16780 [Croceicoccus sp. 1NDH52]|nr:hypothetical protein [Croceicoccus gelatinilyticus]
MEAQAHPFLDPDKVHALRLAAPEPVSGRQLRERVLEPAPLVLAPKKLKTAKPQHRFRGPLIALVAAVVIPTAAAAMIPVGSSLSDAPSVRFKLDEANVPVAGNQLPDEYPGLYPGEQHVFYFLKPLPGLATTRQQDAAGCQWDVARAGTGYPVIGEDGKQRCTDPSHAMQPYRARMIGDTFPSIKGSAMQIVGIVDAATGQSLMPSLAQPIEASPVEAPIEDLKPAGMKAEIKPVPAPAVPVAGVVPSRPMVTAPSASARPRIDLGGGEDRMVSMTASQEQMVPISGGHNPEEVMVPISGDPTPLRAIRPGEPMAAARPLSARYNPNDKPFGSPLEP